VRRSRNVRSWTCSCRALQTVGSFCSKTTNRSSTNLYPGMRTAPHVGYATNSGPPELHARHSRAVLVRRYTSAANSSRVTNSTPGMSSCTRSARPLCLYRPTQRPPFESLPSRWHLDTQIQRSKPGSRPREARVDSHTDGLGTGYSNALRFDLGSPGPNRNGTRGRVSQCGRWMRRASRVQRADPLRGSGQ
jgi:hypothetical protein